MVGEQSLGVGGAGSHGDTGCAGVIVLLHRAGAARPLEVVADISGGHADGGNSPSFIALPGL